MSKLADKLHDLVARVKGGAEVEIHHVEAVVTELEGHLLPAVRETVDSVVHEALQEIKSLLAEARAADLRVVAQVKADLLKAFDGAKGAVDASTAAPAVETVPEVISEAASVPPGGPDTVDPGSPASSPVA